MVKNDSVSISPRATPYRHDQLQRVLAPRSVAVMGASPRAGSFGQWTVQNLAGFKGNVYPINPKYTEVAGRACHASLAQLPEVPDCAIIVAGLDAVEPLLHECAEAGIGGAVVYAAGYAETGKEEGALAQRRLAELAHTMNLRIIGPNCIGIFNHALGFCGSFSPGVELPMPRARGSIGLVSQSGALGIAMAQATVSGTSFSQIYTAGNSCDVDVADLVAYLAEDSGCQAIACLFEGMATPSRMIAAADIARSRGKPLVIFKIATGEQGAQAAMSHTGSLAGSEVAYRAAFERTGAILVDDYEALIETTNFFARAGRPTARGVAVASTSGGAAIMAADKAEKHVVPLPQPHPATTAVLVQHIPDFGSSRNPCDVTAQVMSNPGSLAAVGEALMGDNHYGALVFPTPSAADYVVPRVATFEALAQAHGKPVCVVWLALWQEGPGLREAMAQAGTPVFHSMDRCFATLAAWHRWDDRLRQGEQQSERRSASSARPQAAAMLAAAAHRTLTEREAKKVLALYDVPVVLEQLVDCRDDAIAAARRLGFPVAIKVESPDIPHKTEAGVVRLGIRTEEDLLAAYDAVLANARRAAPHAHINGVLVQPMVPQGIEIMVGARVDPQFGTMVVVGLGGVLVELVKDTVAALAPVTPEEALGMLARLKGQAALDGFRGSAAVDRAQLAEVIARLSEFAADHSESIDEMDVNPLICSAGRIQAVDALIVRKA